MEVNHFLLLICSLEKLFLVKWFFNYSTRRQCIVFLSSLVVLFEETWLSWGNYFRREIHGERENFRGTTFLRGNCPGSNYIQGQLSSGAIVRGEIIREAIIQGKLTEGQLSGEGRQFSSKTIVLESLLSYGSSKITWKNKTIVSPLPQCLWPLDFAEWWLTMRGSHPKKHMARGLAR